MQRIERKYWFRDKLYKERIFDPKGFMLNPVISTTHTSRIRFLSHHKSTREPFVLF